MAMIQDNIELNNAFASLAAYPGNATRFRREKPQILRRLVFFCSWNWENAAT